MDIIRELAKSMILSHTKFRVTQSLKSTFTLYVTACTMIDSRLISERFNI